MGIVNLDHPNNVVHKTNRHSKWDVTAAEWSPHKTDHFALAVSSPSPLLFTYIKVRHSLLP